MRTRAMASLRRPVAFPDPLAERRRTVAVSLVKDEGASTAASSSSTMSSISAASSLTRVSATELLNSFNPAGDMLPAGASRSLLRDLADLERHRRLGLVRVVRAGVDLELL